MRGLAGLFTCHVIINDQAVYDALPEPDDDENDMLDLAFGLTETSRLGCRVIAAKELGGMAVAAQGDAELRRRRVRAEAALRGEGLIVEVISSRGGSRRDVGAGDGEEGGGRVEGCRLYLEKVVVVFLVRAQWKPCERRPPR